MSDKQTLRLRLGKALRGLRKARGLTEAQLAQRMGKRPTSARQISRWELGQNSPGSDQLFAILLALDMSFADLHRELNPAPATSPNLLRIARQLQALA